MISVKFLPSLTTHSTPEEFLNILTSEISPVHLNELNWPNFPYLPEISFRIAHFSEGIVLHYNVTENISVCEVTSDNGPVYNDSCVEFFFDPSEDGSYYNFEWNKNGTMLLGYGSDRYNRTLAPLEKLKQTRRYAFLKNNSGTETWELLLIIPFPMFFMHTINTLRNIQCKANFYKCGNKTPKPHYISWHKIKSPRPDFHRPEDFGILVFE